MGLFYLLYFCVYFNNEFVLAFLQTLIPKIKVDECSRHEVAFKEIEDLLDLIDKNGLERLRRSGDQENVRLYHLVFYYAINDQLRIVYSKILRKLKSIQLRDKDGVQLLVTRDYELIRECCKKSSQKLDLISKGFKKEGFISHSYRFYNPAYFEELLLRYRVDDRIAKNFRERFIIDRDATFQVLQMYSKKDYLD